MQYSYDAAFGHWTHTPPNAVKFTRPPSQSTPAAYDVVHSTFKKYCEEEGPWWFEPGLYLMYMGGVIYDTYKSTLKEGYAVCYMITAGACSISKKPQYYKGNVTCCPQQ